MRKWEGYDMREKGKEIKREKETRRSNVKVKMASWEKRKFERVIH